MWVVEVASCFSLSGHECILPSFKTIFMHTHTLFETYIHTILSFTFTQKDFLKVSLAAMGGEAAIYEFRRDFTALLPIVQADSKSMRAVGEN